MGAREETPSTCLLEELIMAMVGHTGDIFVDTNSDQSNRVADPSACTFQVATDLDFLSLSDRRIMSSLIELGFHFCGLEAFVCREEFAWRRKGGSQYRCAVANGIKELLDVYAAAMLQVQHRLRETVNPSLATLNYFLMEYRAVLPSLHHITYEMHTRNMKGNEIFLMLHRKAACGIAEVQSCLERLQWHCHQKLFKQLKAWMVHGLLVDKNEEFFIQQSAIPDPATPPSTGLHAKSASTAHEWHKGFAVRMDLLPPQIAGETALSILFVGKAVRVLMPPDADAMEDQLGATVALERLQAMPAFDTGQFEFVIEGIREQAAKKLWQLVAVQGEFHKHLAALRDYFLLGRGDFWQSFMLESHGLMSLPGVPATAEANISIPFQQSASKSSSEADPLFTRVRIRFPTDAPTGPSAAPSTSYSSLPGSALPFRSVPISTPHTLLGAQIRSLDAATPAQRGSSSNPLTAAARPAAGFFTGAQTASHEEATPTITPQTGDTKAGKGRRSVRVPDYDPNWDSLTLEYKVEWPLHLLLSPEVMLRYCRMFQYLFRLKRLQLELEMTWAAISCHQGQQAQQKPPRGMVPVWQVRGHMAHLINNLQLYIQVDVIEVQYSKLQGVLHDARDLKTATRAHEGFLAACMVQSCLDVPMFSSLLSKILTNCKAFCAHAQQQGATAQEDTLGYPIKLVENFQRTSRMLYKLLSTPSMQSRARAPFLRQLLLRLNFNDFVQQDTDRHAAARQPGYLQL